MDSKIKNHIFIGFHHIIFTIVCVIIIGPLLIVFISSFKNSVQLTQQHIFSMPNPLVLENYVEVIQKGNALVAFKNSFLLVIFTITINTFLGSMVAYSLSRFEFKLKNVYFAIFSVAMLLPSFIMEITRFGIISSLGVYNTLAAPILIYISTDLLQIYIYKQYMDQIPFSVDESAIIDGASFFRVYFNIILPLILPAIATLSILKSITVLNDMFTPYLYMPSPENATLTTMLMNYFGRTSDWAKLSAGIVVVMLPNLIIYLLFRKKILSGVTAGAVKE